MQISRGALLSGAFVVVLAPAAFAADAVIRPIQVAAPIVAKGLMYSTIFDLSAGARIVRSTDDPPNNTHFTFGGNGYANVPLSGRSSVQFDLQGEGYADKGTDAPHGAGMAGIHLSMRDPGSYLLGGFAGVGMPFADDMADDTPGAHSGFGYVVGGEGQLYLQNLTLYGQAGFGDFRVDEDSGPEGFVNGWFARIVGRWFITDDMMVQAEYSHGYTKCYIDGLCAPTQDAGIFDNWGLKLEKRISSTMPIYGFLDYQGGRYHATEDPDTSTEHAFKVGLSFRMGAPTLKANDRFGATLDMPMLPVRAAAWNAALD
jgi:hypothetical protein